MRLCGFEVGNDQPIFLIAGTCVIEGEASALEVAGDLKAITDELGIPFIYKSSFDKANRSSRDSFRGPGMEEGLRILGEVKKQLAVPVLTDVHEDTPMDEVADVVDVLQTPAFLCRQTNFILRTAAAGLPVQDQVARARIVALAGDIDRPRDEEIAESVPLQVHRRQTGYRRRCPAETSHAFDGQRLRAREHRPLGPGRRRWALEVHRQSLPLGPHARVLELRQPGSGVGVQPLVVGRQRPRLIGAPQALQTLEGAVVGAAQIRVQLHGFLVPRQGGSVVALVVVDLGAGTAGTGFAHHPKVV